MNESSERFMAEARKWLAAAVEFEAGRKIDQADACGAIAASKIAAAIRIAEKPPVLKVAA